MRARLVALVLVGLLLAPLPVLAASERAEPDSSLWVEGLLSRVAGPILNLGSILSLFGASEEPPPPPPASASGEGDGDLGPGLDPDG